MLALQSDNCIRVPIALAVTNRYNLRTFHIDQPLNDLPAWYAESEQESHYD
jgi:hypothetical protein